MQAQLSKLFLKSIVYAFKAQLLSIGRVLCKKMVDLKRIENGYY